MPDIKTALQEALKKTATAWAADDEAHQQIEPQQEKAMPETTEKKDGRIKSNVSRVTFYFIRDNAGMTAAQVIIALMEQGHKAVSVGSLINQMLNTRMIMVDDQGRLSAVIKEYIPIQSKKTKAQVRAKPAAPVKERKHVTLVNPTTGVILNPKPAPMPEPETVLPTLPTADSVIANMSVGEAFRLYTKLKTMFGGN